MKKKSHESLVYSTDHGRICPHCEKSVAECRCKEGSDGPVGDGVVRVSKSTKGRKGKGVTVISGLPVSLAELKELGKELKRKCGTGGTVKDNCIEIQGDQVDLLVKELRDRGWDAKRSGG